MITGVPSYANDNGICLLRYRMKSGGVYWYFTTQGGLDQETGDYYRCKTEADEPPLGEIHGTEGVFEINKCPAGVLPPPQITLVTPEEREELAAVEAASTPREAPPPEVAVTSDHHVPDLSGLQLEETVQDEKEAGQPSLISAFRPTQGDHQSDGNPKPYTDPYTDRIHLLMI